jgi:hypothetical protein
VLYPSQALAQTQDQINIFRWHLLLHGFIVQQGQFVPVSPAEMFCNHILPSGYGFNRASPYITTILPKAPDQEVDSILPYAFFLRPDEAVVHVFRTPPPVKYFSLLTYLGLRYFEEEGRKRRIYASLGDSFNNETIFTEGTPYGAQGDPFNQLTIVITTADREVDRRVRAAARSAGFDPAIINTNIIPRAAARMGADREADEFNSIIRTAYFQNDGDEEVYFERMRTSTVFRVTPRSSINLDPFPTPDLRIRGTGQTEFDLMDDMRALRQAIFQQHSSQQAQELDTRAWFPEGFEAIQRGIDVLGEARDTTYWVTDDFTLGIGEYIIVYGVLHDRTGKATYSNINLYDGSIVPDTNARANLAVAMVDSINHLPGTAAKYIRDNPNVDKLYAYKISRNCNGEADCLEVPSDTCDRLPMQVFFLAFRAYLEPGKGVGPAYNEIILDRAIKFSGASTRGRELQ